MKRLTQLLNALAMVLVIVTAGHAQKTPTWSWDSGTKVLWQQITPLGNLVVNTREALIGVDTQTGETMWTLQELGNLQEDSYGIVPTTFFVEITRGDRITVVDAWEGKILFDSEAAGIKNVLSKNILYRGGAMLIYGFQPGLKPIMGCYSISTGQELWTNENIFSKDGEKKSGFGSFVQAAQISADQSEQGGNAFELIEPDERSFIIATVNGIFKIETNTGNNLWSADIPQPKGAQSTSQEYKLIQAPGPDFYFAKSNFIQAMDIESGAEVWPTPVKINGIVDRVITHESGLIILPKIDPNNNIAAPKANLVNYETGETYWGKNGKGIGLSGSITGTYFTSEGLVLSMQKGDDAFINILDIDAGAMKYSKSEKISGYLRYTEVTPSGLWYVTNPDSRAQGEVNLYNLKTGKNVLSKSVKSGKPDSDEPVNTYDFLTANSPDKGYFFSHREKSVYEVDKISGQVKPLLEDIKFEGKEKPNKLELRDGGLVLSSEQNVLMIDINGGQKFHSYYRAPDQPGILKAIYGMAAVTAAIYSAEASMASASAAYAGTQTTDPTGKAIAGAVSEGYDEMAGDYKAYSKTAMSAAKRRFKATSESNNFIFMMVELEKEKTGAAKMFEGATFGLAQVSKDSGDVIDLIDMAKEKEPSYAVDPIAKAIYYRLNDNSIVAFNF